MTEDRIKDVLRDAFEESPFVFGNAFTREAEEGRRWGIQVAMLEIEYGCGHVNDHWRAEFPLPDGGSWDKLAAEVAGQVRAESGGHWDALDGESKEFPCSECDAETAADLRQKAESEADLW